MSGKRDLFKGDYLRPLTVDDGSWDAIRLFGDGSHHFTGIMRLPTGVIYLGLLRGEGNDPYNATEPASVALSRTLHGVGLTVCAGGVIHSITHNNSAGNTGHDNLLTHVVGQLGNADSTEFCGFALRLKGRRDTWTEVKPHPLHKATLLAELAPTSRSLNPGYNGTLEETLFEAIYGALAPMLRQIGFTLLRSTARIDAQSANAAKATSQYGVTPSAAAVGVRSNLFGAIKARGTI